jgi:hypothetical protein
MYWANFLIIQKLKNWATYNFLIRSELHGLHNLAHSTQSRFWFSSSTLRTLG